MVYLNQLLDDVFDGLRDYPISDTLAESFRGRLLRIKEELQAIACEPGKGDRSRARALLEERAKRKASEDEPPSPQPPPTPQND